jgi:salicylate hydroxylase
VSERQTIVVVGGGIGGLSAALSVAAAGYRVVVAERSPDLSAAGAGIQIAPNAGRILADLGLDGALAAAAIEPVALDVRSGTTGKLLTALPATAFRERYGFPYRVIHRADLQAALAAAVGANAGITLELGTTVPQFLVNADTLLVRIQGPRGIDVVPAAALIAADGVWSTFRDHIPGAAQPVGTGRTAWRATLPADIAADLVAMDRTGLWLGRNAHLVHYPISQGAAVNIVAIVQEKWERKGWSAVGARADIAAHFRGWPAAALKLLAAPVSWQKFALMTVDPHAAWTHGRLALLGDAAHAMLPFLAQGAAMAIEDAALLGRALTDARDIPAALHRYAAARKPRVTRMAEASRGAGDQYHQSGVMALARDTALRFAGPKLILDRNDWIYRWKPGDPDEAPR